MNFKASALRSNRAFVLISCSPNNSKSFSTRVSLKLLVPPSVKKYDELYCLPIPTSVSVVLPVLNL